MKPIKMLGFVWLAVLMAVALVSTSSAMAESTSLCSADWEEVAEESACGITHVHESTLDDANAKLLTNIITVECDVLFLGDTVKETSEPLLIKGGFTYSNCGTCTVEETSGNFNIEVLRLGHETADLTYEGEVHVSCSGLNCYYDGEELVGTGKGPLLSSEANGSNTISEATLKKVKGLFCPSSSELDITTTPLQATYLGGHFVHYCVLYEHAHGFYLNINANKQCYNPDATRLGNFMLVEGPPGLTAGTMVCAKLIVKPYGLYKSAGNGRKCAEDSASNVWEYELGTIQ